MNTLKPTMPLAVQPHPLRSPSHAHALGQHFLTDPSVVQKILAAADLDVTDTVVEIGPGRGVLTRHLVNRVTRVVAVELDQELASSLPQRLGNPSNLAVVCADARTWDSHLLQEAGASWKLVANLPYYAANLIIRRLLEQEPRPSLMVVMVQKEVAASMAASPGHMGLLSVAVQFYGRPRIVCTVPPRAFRPPPKVSSAVVRIDLHPQPLLPVEQRSGFFHVVRAGFFAPRKQLRNSLCHGLALSTARVSAILEQANIDSTLRPGALSLEQWTSLYRAWVQS